MEIKQEITENNKKLDENQRSDLAKKIAGWYDSWDNDRSQQITTARELMQEVYLNQPSRKGKDKEDDWMSDVHLNALYNIKRARKAAMWREIWSQPAQMFDVKGTDKKTEQLAKAQKANIVDSFNKMNVSREIDKSVDDWFDIGEMILKTDWVKKTKIVKRQENGVGWVLKNVVANITGAGSFEKPMLKDVEIPYYENARVERISPIMFVFDHSKYKINNKDSWDSIVKIYKRFDSLENIKSNKMYKLTPDQINNLKGIKEDTTEVNQDLTDIRDRNEYAGEYSILYAHGDFTIDGKLYKNYVAEVVAGKYLVRFEENPMFINPFILCATEVDPITKRGISPLKSVKDMTKEAENLTNVAFDVQKLTANPPAYAQEGMFDETNSNKDGTVTYAPGKIITWKTGFSGIAPMNINVSANGIADLLRLLEQKISDLSSVSSVMYGNIESEKRTATELNLADKGSTSQISKDLDTIYQDLIIPMVKNVAELLAIFKNGVDFVYTEDKGVSLEYKIDNVIRQAEYNYIYEDRNALADRKERFDNIFQVFLNVGKHPELFKLMNWNEIITTFIENVGYDNASKFFANESPFMQMAKDFDKLPPEIQQQYVPVIEDSLRKAIELTRITQQQGQVA